MAPMAPKHASIPVRATEGTAHRDRLLPVLFLIVGCGLLEVWASWLMIGSVSGFPKLGRMTTGWILPVSTEAYWSIAVVAWLADPAGPRSKRFAMWTAGVMFALSLTGQELGHLTAVAHASPSMALVMFVTALPLVAVALGAVLIHLRQADREEIAAKRDAAIRAEREAEQLRAEADERTALRAALEAERAAHRADTETANAELNTVLEAERAARANEVSALRQELDDEQAQRETAAQEAARQTAAQIAALGERFTETEAALAGAEERAAVAEAKAERLNRKLNPNSGRKMRANGSAGAGRNAAGAKVPNDIDARAEALSILAAEPGISGAELGERCSKSERWGQLRKKEFGGHVAEGGAPAENADS